MRVGLDADDAVLREALAALADESDRVQDVARNHWSEDVQLEVSVRSSDSRSLAGKVRELSKRS